MTIILGFSYGLVSWYERGAERLYLGFAAFLCECDTLLIHC